MEREHPCLRRRLSWLLLSAAATSPAWGQFVDQTSLNVPTVETRGFLTGDFDGDGDPDLVYVDQTNLPGGNLYLVENLGAGRPAPARQLLSDASQTEWLRAADMDGDLDLDLVFGAKDLPVIIVPAPGQVPPWTVVEPIPFDRVAVALNDGTGNFTVTHHEVPFYETGLDARLGDMDADSDLDLFLLTTTGLTTMRNDGTGALVHVGDFPRHDPSLVPAVPAGGFLSETSEELFVGDFDGDGDADAGVYNRGFVLFTPATPPFLSAIHLNKVSLHLSDGAGNLAFSSNLDLGAKAAELVTGDWNLDGLTDFAAVVSGDAAALDPGSTRVYRNDGLGAGFASTLFSPNFHPFRIVSADFTGDGIADVATYGLDGLLTLPPIPPTVREEVTILPGNGLGGFLAPISTKSGEHHFVAAADFDGDGKADLAGLDDSRGQGIEKLQYLLTSPRSFPLHPGTGGDLVLASAVGGNPPTSAPPLDVKQANVGDPITLVVSTGSLTGGRLFAFMGLVPAPGFVAIPINGLTGLFDFGPIWSIAELPPLSTGSASFSFNAPNVPGMAFFVQFAVVSPLAANGLYASTDVHSLRIQ